MIRRAVGEAVMQRVDGEEVAAVVQHSLERRKVEAPHADLATHARAIESQHATHCVQHETLQRVVVEGAIGIGDQQAVVVRVDVLVE